MARLLRMPEVAANATEAVLHEWPVAEDSSAFAADDALATVETEKAVVDVEADAAGVIAQDCWSPPGARSRSVRRSRVLGDPGETVDDLDALLAELGVARGAAPVAPGAPPVPDDARRRPADAATQPCRRRAAPAVNERHRHGRIFASPLARRLAREAGLPVEEHHRHRARRPDRAARRRARPSTPGPRRPPHRCSGGRPRTGSRQGARPPPASTDVPHTRMRRAIARRLGGEQADRAALLPARHGPRRPAAASCAPS